MNIICSIHNQYTKLIFSGKKDLEFRNRIGVFVNEGDRLYVYETKNVAGSGMVIGSAIIDAIIPIPYHKQGTYFILPYYVEKYGTEEDKETVKQAMEIELDHYDKSIVLDYLYDEQSLSYMKKKRDVPDPRTHMFRGYSHTTYNYLCEKAKCLCRNCDDWAKTIGYYNENETSYWKYAIRLTDIVKFDSGKPIQDFRNRNGESIKKAPQSWCYTLD